ncbi:MDIS1-interacting receptor like kinase 2 [Citrus sinensis]|uniref:MDIS1-interacting receptor like kinase 2 n=1 Tax=Citrus sinensis TaxID=2711 RepID=A0ACB8MAG3_CITSI|nr:MDIS1-interacting receptor like kinase 2 [Citrus sinensis]
MAGERRLASKIQIGTKLAQKGGRKWEIWPVVHDSNTLFAIIPPQIGNISNLKFLDMGNNQLSGVIPQEIDLLTHLKHLYINVNKLRGSVPREVGQLSSLKQLFLSTLDLSINKFSGSMPNSLSNLTSLSLFHLDLSENQLSGSIPHFLGNLSNLAVLHLGDNSLFGSIPPILGKVQSLLSLGFDLNLLNGVLPPSISNLSNLEGLYLYSSLVSPEIGNLLQLIELEIDNKQLFGQIPKSPRNFTSLNIVHLEQNHLTGNIYEVFGIYPNLTFLDLSQNNFYGEISSNWGKCHIPPKIGKLYQLHKLDFSLNHIVGELPIELGNLKSLNYRALNGNKVYGSLPRVLGSISDLEYLDLFSHNFLGGEIPPQICNLESLEKLNLSYNNLSGLIPDISYNELRGLIRNSTGIHYNLVDALQGNKGLCGDVDCFQHCKDYVTHKHVFKKKWFLNMFPLFGILELLFFVVRMISGRMKKASRENKVKLFSILSFEGKILYEEVIRATNNFDAKYCISTGGQASVYKAELPSWEIVAVKKFHSPHPDMVVQQAFSNEIKALTELRHRNIVKFYGFSFHPRQSFLLYEYLGRDISSKNVLLGLDYDAHVSDFGISKFLKPDSSNWSEFVGTFGYLAYTMKVNEKCHAYSFGILTLEVIQWSHPINFISSISSSSPNRNISLNELLDPRLQKKEAKYNKRRLDNRRRSEPQKIVSIELTN